MTETYLGGAFITAIYLINLNRPRDAGGWLAFAGFVAAWPVCICIALYGLAHPR